MGDEVLDPEVVVGEVVESGFDHGIELPDDPAEAVDVLVAAVIEARRTAASHLDDLRRVAAEFDNFRKRAARERVDTIDRAAQRVIQAVLPVLDSLDAALEHVPDDADPALVAGLRGTHQQLLDVLAREGLAPIAAVGMPFDPQFHEAVTGGGDGHLVVTGEMRRGYTLKDRVIRPALVQVAAEDVGEGDAR
ncbi:MAG TPA: nucleotide exchange factor GrpE [Acidimicrobiia bacterium]